MLAKNWMSKDVVTIDIDDSMQDAINLLKKHNIRLLPVMNKGKLAGVITDRDVKRASASDATTLEIHELIYLLSRIKIKDIMNKNPITIPVDYTIEETADMLLKNKISGAPVVNDRDELVGVITQTDLFKVIISLSGFGKRGVQIACQIEDRPGSITEIADIIREYGGRLVSILTSYEGAPEGYRKAYFRTYGIDKITLQKLKNTLKEKVTLLYIVDHRDNKREIY